MGACFSSLQQFWNSAQDQVTYLCKNLITLCDSWNIHYTLSYTSLIFV